MKKKLLNNLGLKLISVVIAIAVWFVAVMIDNPKESTSFSGIQVVLKNTELLENENKVYEILDNTDIVRVTVEAPKDVISNIRSSDIVATADVSKLTEVNTIAIEYDVTTENVEILGIRGNHDVVRLSVEERAKKWVNVQYRTTGEVAEGYMVANITSDQTRIEVIGPKSAVESIHSALLIIDVKDAVTNVSANVEVQLCDVEGKSLNLPSVEKTDNIHVDVQVLAMKEVPVEWNPTGIPAEGYLATGVVEHEPSTVLIAGTVAALSNVSKIVLPETELDVTDAAENVVNDINIRRYLPDNIILADGSFNGRVTATVYIEPRAERTLILPETSVEVCNLPEGFGWELQEETYRLRISGLQAEVSAVDQNSLRGTLDIAEWMAQNTIGELAAGTYDIPIAFVFDRDVSVSSDVVARIVIYQLEEE